VKILGLAHVARDVSRSSRTNSETYSMAIGGTRTSRHDSARETISNPESHNCKQNWVFVHGLPHHLQFHLMFSILLRTLSRKEIRLQTLLDWDNTDSSMLIGSTTSKIYSSSRYRPNMKPCRKLFSCLERSTLEGQLF
jgi:hypothetical protein